MVGNCLVLAVVVVEVVPAGCSGKGETRPEQTIWNSGRNHWTELEWVALIISWVYLVFNFNQENILCKIKSNRQPKLSNSIFARVRFGMVYGGWLCHPVVAVVALVLVITYNKCVWCGGTGGGGSNASLQCRVGMGMGYEVDGWGGQLNWIRESKSKRKHFFLSFESCWKWKRKRNKREREDNSGTPTTTLPYHYKHYHQNFKASFRPCVGGQILLFPLIIERNLTLIMERQREIREGQKRKRGRSSAPQREGKAKANCD